MDSLEVFRKLFDGNKIIGTAVVNQIKNWPTRPVNLTKNCRIFEQLNKDDSGTVEGLSDDCYELLCVSAYVRKALLQRGLMNIQYYILLDEVRKTQIEEDRIGSKGGRKQKGGMKIWQLLARLGIAFALLGSSEGVNGQDPEVRRFVEAAEAEAHAKANEQGIGIEMGSLCDPSSGNCEKEPGGSAVIFSAPVEPASSKEEFLKARLSASEKIVHKMLVEKEWVLPERSVIIATGVIDSQDAFFKRTMDELNARLASSSKDAARMCGEIVEAATNADVFSNEAFVQRVLAIAEKNVALGQAITTSEGVQNTVRYVTKGSFNLASGALSGVVGYKAPEREVDKSAVMKQAYEEVTSEMNMGRVSQVESFAYSYQYQQLCRATPTPSFQVSTDGGSL